MERDCIIYGLIDPRSGLLRYVGKTVRPLRIRLAYHMRDKCRCHRTAWLKSIATAGLTPIIKELETVSEKDGSEAEVSMIAFIRSTGATLVNGTNGGEGMSNVTPAIRKKMSESRRRNPTNPKAIAAMRAANLGRVVTPEVRRKMSKIRKSFLASPAERARIAKALRGHGVSASTRAKLSAKIKGCKHTPEAIAKIAHANRNRSPESRAKTRATWARKRAQRIGPATLFGFLGAQ